MIRYRGIEGSVSILRKIDARAFEMYFLSYIMGESAYMYLLLFSKKRHFRNVQ